MLWHRRNDIALFSHSIKGWIGLGLTCATIAGCKKPDSNELESVPEAQESPLPNSEASEPSLSTSVESTQSDVLPDTNQPDEGNKDCECAEHSDLVYVLSSDHSLWRFNPKTKEFTDLGRLDCNTSTLDTPFSLGVDRHSQAWVQMQPSGKIYTVDTLNKNTCKDSGYTPGNFEFHAFGMAFLDQPSTPSCERLYMHSFDGLIWSEGKDIGAMGMLDPETMKAQSIGRIDFNGGELSGTKDGRLFAFAGEPAKLVEYDPDTATVKKQTDLGGLSLSMAFAFAFWGGDFYFFTQADDTLPPRSKVTKLDYDGDGSLTTFVEQAPIHIVGAGVSVCAPLTPPV